MSSKFITVAFEIRHYLVNPLLHDRIDTVEVHEAWDGQFLTGDILLARDGTLM